MRAGEVSEVVATTRSNRWAMIAVVLLVAVCLAFDCRVAVSGIPREFRPSDPPDREEFSEPDVPPHGGIQSPRPLWQLPALAFQMLPANLQVRIWLPIIGEARRPATRPIPKAAGR